MFEPHWSFNVNMLFTMFGRVVFFLYLPAICFSFALFPNDGHKTQRRQNSEENMVNETSVQGGNLCFEQLRPCLDNLRPLQGIDGLQGLVVDGRLAVPCASNISEENWNCIDSVSQCRDDVTYTHVRRSQVVWDFVCKNSLAFVAGQGCWRSSGFEPAIIKCVSSNYHCIPTCLQGSVEKIPDCSVEDSFLVRRLASTGLGGMQASC
ncbi:uncharacterized protein [Haliotis asinina]|uniref:uncharacterized protein n=1 Tax=Haliotis asinina TaxID=109174 RepID=UPI0035321D80